MGLKVFLGLRVQGLVVSLNKGAQCKLQHNIRLIMGTLKEVVGI